MHSNLGALAVASLVLPLFQAASAFQCTLTASSITYDISALSGLRTTDSETDTPPTRSAARVRMGMCGEGVGSEDGVEEEDQCPSNTLVCLKLTNIKPPHAERVTSVIPFWMADTPDESIWTTPLGSKGEEGLRIWVEGPDYAGARQNLNLTLWCDKSSTAANPTFLSYTASKLSLEWRTPDACPRDGGSDDDSGEHTQPSDTEGESSSGWGFFGFIKFIFWAGIFGLGAYFVVGILYNRHQYSSHWLDSIPHRDFWREVPTMGSDLVRHVFTNVRNSGPGGRGGYSSLG